MTFCLANPEVIKEREASFFGRHNTEGRRHLILSLYNINYQSYKRVLRQEPVNYITKYKFDELFEGLKRIRIVSPSEANTKEGKQFFSPNVVETIYITPEKSK